MSTLQSLKRRVYAVLRDSEKSFVEDQEVEDLLNEAYLDLTARLRLLRKEATGTTTATGTITLPTDYIEMVWLSVLPTVTSEYQEHVEWADDRVFDSWRLPGDTPESLLARIFNGTIETYPVAASCAYTMRYVYKPTALDSAADEPSIPEELQVRMVNYARGHTKYKEGEIDEGDRYLALYEQGLPSSPMSSHRERPGPINMTPAPGWAEDYS